MQDPKDRQETTVSTPPKIEAPPEGPGSELRGEPVMPDAAAQGGPADAKPGTGEREAPAAPNAPDTAQEGRATEGMPNGTPASATEKDQDAQEQPPRPPGKEDEGVRGRPGQQQGT